MTGQSNWKLASKSKKLAINGGKNENVKLVKLDNFFYEISLTGLFNMVVIEWRRILDNVENNKTEVLILNDGTVKWLPKS